MRELNRAAATGRPAHPVRLVHLGLGAFHRAHQVPYTDAANAAAPDEPWGIAGFTGRRPDAAVPLAAQDGLYHLLVRDRDGDRAQLVESLAAAHDGADLESWCGLVAAPEVGCLTLTVTEAGYRRAPDGGPDLDDPDIAADLALPGSEHCDRAARTAPGRLLQGLAARRAAGSGPITIVPCDNLVANGPTVRRVVLGFAERVNPSLRAWIEDNVAFVSTTIDRITPATTGEDRATVAQLTGWDDRSPVVAEPFTEWVLAGDFPAGRPAWDRAGARFVPDVTPFEDRKLWLLNGAHSLLAYAATARGHRTVADAVADPACSGWMRQWWDEACRHLPLPDADLAAYRDALTKRFANPRIRHTLAQIAADGSQKLPIRTVPVLRRERAEGRLPAGAVRTLAGWLVHLRDGADVRDPRAEELVELARREPLADAARNLLAVLDQALPDDADLVAAVTADAIELSAS